MIYPRYQGYQFNRKTVTVTVSNDSPAISVGDMKGYLRIDDTADDTEIAAYIATATEDVKQYCKRAILTETFVMVMDGFSYPDGDDRLAALGPGTHTVSVPYYTGGSGSINLSFPPLQSVTSLVTYDTSDSASTFSSSRYGVDLQGGRIYLNQGETWPSSLRDYNAIEITYVAGYGSGNIPEPILQSIRELVGQMYDGTCEGVRGEIARRLAPYRLLDQLAA